MGKIMCIRYKSDEELMEEYDELWYNLYQIEHFPGYSSMLARLLRIERELALRENR